MSGQVSNARPQPCQRPVADWIRQYEAGVSIVRIACDAGVSDPTVTKFLRLAGVPLRGSKPRWRDEQ